MNDFYSRIKYYFPNDYEDMIQAIKQPRSHGFFLNTRKGNIDDLLKLIEFPYKKSSFHPNSFFHQQEHISQSICYDLGIIYPQGVESSFSASLCDLEDPQLILDLCAAPGGKSINISIKYPKAILISNDVNFKRAQVLSSNLERMGINAIVTSREPSSFLKELSDKVDLIILDVPCSGEGMIRKYPEILDDYSVSRINELANIQKDLLDIAYQLLKPGGEIIYSTCTFALEEDEDQIISFLDRHSDMKLVPVDIDDNHSLSNDMIKLTFLNCTEGQFISILRKKGDLTRSSFNNMKTSSHKLINAFINESILSSDINIYQIRDSYYCSRQDFPELSGPILRFGCQLGHIERGRFEPAHDLFRQNDLVFKNVFPLSKELLPVYLSGNTFHAEVSDGYYQITYQGYPVGFGKFAKGSFKNKFPKGLRRML